MAESGPTVDYLKKHGVEAFVQEMVSDLKSKPANPFRAMAEYVRANKLGDAAAPAVESCGDAAYDASPKFLTPKPLGGGLAEYAAGPEIANEYKAAAKGTL
eukprot:COSAG05_NODE_10943_length_538_cov_0.822323_1_plen_100_part_10